MTVKETQELVKIWEEKNLVDNNQLTNIALLTEAVGELTRVIAKGLGKTQIPIKDQQRLNKNIGEILWRTMSIANHNNVQSSDAVIATLEKKNKEQQ